MNKAMIDLYSYGFGEKDLKNKNHIVFLIKNIAYGLFSYVDENNDVSEFKNRLQNLYHYIDELL